MSSLPTDPDALLTTEQAAAILGCAPKTLEMERTRRRWDIPFVRLSRAIRYRRCDLLTWIASRVVVAGQGQVTP